jgi:hypothetical protein
VKFTSVLLTVVAAVFLQVALARYTVGGAWAFDLVLVGVVFAALQWGPVAGIVAGTLGGLLQDLLAGEIVGLGGLTKTIVGFVSGVVGTQFVLTRPGRMTSCSWPRGPSAGHARLRAVIDQRGRRLRGALWARRSSTACAFVIFQVTALPGVVSGSGSPAVDVQPPAM